MSLCIERQLNIGKTESETRLNTVLNLSKATGEKLEHFAHII